MMKNILTLAAIFYSFLTFSGTFTSHTSGSFNDGVAAWTIVGDADGIPDADDDVIISAGTTMNWGPVGTIHTYIRNLTINVGGVLQGPNSTSRQLHIHGDYLNNGTETSRGIYVFESGTGTTISGSGTFADFAMWVWTASRTIASDVTKSNYYYARLWYGAQVTNQGNVTFQREVVGADPTVALINEGTMTIGRDQVMLTGTFDASAVGNTVIIDWNSGIFSQNLPTPQNGEYYNLQVGNSNNIDIVSTGNITVLNDLTMTSNSDWNLSTFSLSIGGNWVNNGSGTNFTNGTSLNFTGSGAQSITRPNNSYETIPCDMTVGSNSVLTTNKPLDINGDITISGSLDVSASNHEILLAGNWTNNGTFVPRNGIVDIEGGGAATMDGSGTTSFNILRVSNGTSLSINSGSYEIELNLFIRGNSSMNTNNNGFTILSTPAQTANIANLCSGCSISGNVTMQKVIGAGNANYRDLTSPVMGATVSQWTDDFLISGTSMPAGCAFGGSCFASVKKYDISSQSYVDVNDPSEPLTSTLGFECFMGDDLSTFSGTTIDVTGTVRPSSNVQFAMGVGNYNLLGNPYCSAIDWDLLSRGNKVGNYYYIFDSSTGNYEYYDGNSGTSSGSVTNDGRISAMQGFWCETAAGSSIQRSLFFIQAAKLNSNVTLKKIQITDNLLSIKVSNDIEKLSCKSTIKFIAEALPEKDSLDIVKFNGPKRPIIDKSPKIYFADDHQYRMMATNQFENITEEFDIDFYSEVGGSFTISAENLINFNTFRCVTIVDMATGVNHNLKASDYHFYHTGSMKSTDRFKLIVSNESFCDIENADNKVVSTIDFSVNRTGPNQLRVDMISDLNTTENGTTTVQIHDMLGRVVYTGQQIDPSQVISLSLESGTYIVSLSNSVNRTSRKIVIQ